MTKIHLPREHLIREIECDTHNIKEAITMMDDKFDKKLAKYCKLTVKHIPHTMKQLTLYGA